MRGFGLDCGCYCCRDPRLSGLLTISANGTGQSFEDSFANIESRSYRIANDDGAWAGSGVQVIAAGEEPPPFIDQESMVLTGEDAYDGLVAYVFIDFASGEAVVEAVVVGGEVAPAPDPVAAG